MTARRIVYLAHSFRSDWNNGNAHFLRGLLRGLQQEGHQVICLEPAQGWSYTNLLSEGEGGRKSLAQFAAVYPELDVRTYTTAEDSTLSESLREADLVIVHEWSDRALIDRVLALRGQYRFRALFHDTHHRASSSPAQLAHFRIAEFDGVLAFGEALRQVYRNRWGADRVWTLHEAADVSVFKPQPGVEKTRDLVWIGNWGDGERTEELQQYLLEPSRALGLHNVTIHGVRYPEKGLAALHQAGIAYGGYLANLAAPDAFATARVTVHVPRRQYVADLPGIPTIRVFEALACGIPLVSAPWQDTEKLFSDDDFVWVRDGEQMAAALRKLLCDEAAMAQRSAHGLATIRARHTTLHRARQLSGIMEEVLMRKVSA